MLTIAARDMPAIFTHADARLRGIVDAFRPRHLDGDDLDLAVDAARRRLAGRGNQPAELLDIARRFPTSEPSLRRVLQILL